MFHESSAPERVLISVYSWTGIYVRMSCGYICTSRCEGRPERRRDTRIPVIPSRSTARKLAHNVECRLAGERLAYLRATKWAFRPYSSYSSTSRNIARSNAWPSASPIVAEAMLSTCLRRSYIPQVSYFATDIIWICHRFFVFASKYGRLSAYPQLQSSNRSIHAHNMSFPTIMLNN